MPSLLQFPSNNGESTREQIQPILQAVRRHLAMDVGFVSEFVAENRVIRFSDGADLNNPIVVGRSDPIKESFCYHVAHGLMPELMYDVKEDAVASQMLATHDFPVGAHLSVPLRHADGTPFGTLCCFSFTPDRSLTTRDLGLLRVCADLICAVLQKDRVASLDRETRRCRIVETLEAQALDMVFQPICRTADGHLTGFEALARFRGQPIQPPDAWFAEAEAAGLGEDMEFLAVTKALAALSTLDSSLKLTLNLSPSRVLGSRFETVFRDAPLERVVIELTEHAVIESYEAVREALAPARKRGLRLAVDDVGAGHSTFRHVLDLSPEFIKLDRSLIRGIEADSARRALAGAITSYSRDMGCEVVAEGMETMAEYAALQDIGVTRAQGYLIGRPMPIGEAARVPLRTSLIPNG